MLIGYARTSTKDQKYSLEAQIEQLTQAGCEKHYEEQVSSVDAKREQLEGILKILPWIAQIDAFQHWVYENINHTEEERKAYWLKLSSDYGTGLTDWTGYEDQVTYSWQRQLHLFEVPFYYIEYGIAQLGALGIWKNSQANYQETITNYKDALSLGYTTSIPKIYATAKIKFDFSSHYLKELVDFVQEELGKL